MPFEIPPSVVTYFTDPEVQAAVNDLVEVIDGTKMPSSTFHQVRQFNLAVLMAAQVRADYIELLFRIWDETWGKLDLRALGRPSYEADEGPASIWSTCWLAQTFTRGDLEIVLFVSAAEDRLKLEAQWPVSLGEAQARAIQRSEGWTLEVDDEDDVTATTTEIELIAFFETPDLLLDDLRIKAETLVGHLLLLR